MVLSPRQSSSSRNQKVAAISVSFGTSATLRSRQQVAGECNLHSYLYESEDPGPWSKHPRGPHRLRACCIIVNLPLMLFQPEYWREHDDVWDLKGGGGDGGGGDGDDGGGGGGGGGGGDDGGGGGGGDDDGGGHHPR